MAELSDSEKVAIVSEFILDAPPGEFNEVFNDVRVLLDDDDLLREGAAPAFAKYNRDQFLWVELPDGAKVLITSHGELEPNVYLDPKTRQTFEFDHLKKEVSNVQEYTDIDETAEPWRAAVEKAVEPYVSDHYPIGVCSVYGKTEGGNVTVVVCVESHRFSASNFWNGRWRSEWKVEINGDEAEVSGKTTIIVHYFENGNVQLETAKSVHHTLPASSEAALATELVKLMEKADTGYQSGINECYMNMSDGIFKGMRRALPVTKTKVDWNKIASYKVGESMNKS